MASLFAAFWDRHTETQQQVDSKRREDMLYYFAHASATYVPPSLSLVESQAKLLFMVSCLPVGNRIVRGRTNPRILQATRHGGILTALLITGLLR
jgi:hypothetical protein